MLLIMLISALTAAAAAPPSSPQPQAGSLPLAAARSCPNIQVHHVTKPGRVLRPQRLDELPLASLELSVLREVDGCPERAILRQGLGGR